MTFKDLLPSDNEAILMLDEFAEWVKIDGVILRAVVEKSTAQKSGNLKLNFKGLMGDFVTLYFRTTDYNGKRERLPRNGERVKIYSDEWACDKLFNVVSCADELGICTLVLDAYRQNTLRGVTVNWSEDST